MSARAFMVTYIDEYVATGSTARATSRNTSHHTTARLLGNETEDVAVRANDSER